MRRVEGTLGKHGQIAMNQKRADCNNHRELVMYVTYTRQAVAAPFAALHAAMSRKVVSLRRCKDNVLVFVCCCAAYDGSPSALFRPASFVWTNSLFVVAGHTEEPFTVTNEIWRADIQVSRTLTTFSNLVNAYFQTLDRRHCVRSSKVDRL